MIGYNYPSEMKCRSGVQPPSGVAPSRWRAKMRTKSIPQLTPEQEERFWSKVEVHQPAGCWEWSAEIDRWGYGRFSMLKKHWLAHRVAFSILIGQIPEGLQLDHLCRNRRCVNPDHLQTVTARENLARSQAPAHRVRRSGVCQKGHSDFTVTNKGRWVCRVCSAANQQRYREKKRAEHPPYRGKFCKRGHPLEGDNLRLYRGVHYCRACRAAWSKEHPRSRKADE